jgi:alpha-glucoside transport system permease protein
MATEFAAIVGIAVVVGLPVATVAYLQGVDFGLKVLRRRWRTDRIRPWAWLIPPVVLMGAILGYPLVESVRLSFYGPVGSGSAGLANYRWALTSAEGLAVLRTTALWVVLLPVLTVVIGIAFAVLADRVRYERAAKVIIIAPTAMSFVAAGAVWQLVYSFAPDNQPQTGLLDALWTGVTGSQPVAWLVDGKTNTYALIAVTVWMYLGFAVLILSAAVKGVSKDLSEAARIDGASEWGVFRHILLPSIMPTVAVVATTTLAWSLKIFDIVYVMTGGQFGTDVIGTKVYEEIFTYDDIGKGSALAVILFVAVLPLMVLSARRTGQGGTAQ